MGDGAKQGGAQLTSGMAVEAVLGVEGGGGYAEGLEAGGGQLTHRMEAEEARGRRVIGDMG